VGIRRKYILAKSHRSRHATRGNGLLKRGMSKYDGGRRAHMVRGEKKKIGDFNISEDWRSFKLPGLRNPERGERCTIKISTVQKK